MHVLLSDSTSQPLPGACRAPSPSPFLSAILSHHLSSTAPGPCPPSSPPPQQHLAPVLSTTSAAPQQHGPRPLPPSSPPPQQPLSTWPPASTPTLQHWTIPRALKHTAWPPSCRGTSGPSAAASASTSTRSGVLGPRGRNSPENRAKLQTPTSGGRQRGGGARRGLSSGSPGAKLPAKEHRS